MLIQSSKNLAQMFSTSTHIVCSQYFISAFERYNVITYFIYYVFLNYFNILPLSTEWYEEVEFDVFVGGALLTINY